MTRLMRVFPTLPTLRDDFLFPMQQVFNEIFDEFLSPKTLRELPESIRAKSGYPKLEVGVENNKLVVRAAVPGVKHEDLTVEMVEPEGRADYWPEGTRMLKISGKMNEVYESPEGAVHYRKELRKSAFCRELFVPVEVTGNPEATLQDGILTLTWELPKVEEKKEPTVTKVEVKKA